MTKPKYKHWDVTRTVTLKATAEEVWEVIGGFYTIHLWHPDISITKIPSEQVNTRELRRMLTLPGQPKSIEQLVSMDNDDFHYRYKWHQGEWGESVKNYHSSLRVIAGDKNKTCMVQWASSFDFPTDAISDFYKNGFRALKKRFPTRRK